MGGEKFDFALNVDWLGGSPPRGRGKGFFVSFVAFSFRITPAWAGKSRNVLALADKSGDHPRVGGEKI